MRSLDSRDHIAYINQLKRNNVYRAPGTFEWIIQTAELKRWIGQEQSPTNEPASRILWLYGSPGIGKSNLAITIIEALQNLQPFKDGTKSLAYFFCTSSHERQKTADDILETLIYQFITKQRELIEFLPPNLQKTRENSQVFDTLWSVLMNIGNHDSTGEKYCVIDGLDECEENGREDLLEQIRITFDSNRAGDPEPKINILILSRLSPEITGLQHLTSKNLALCPEIQHDIHIFIKGIIAKLANKKWPQHKLEEVSQILCENAGGTFLWVSIVSHELMKKTWTHATATLEVIPIGLNLMFKNLLCDARKATGKIGDLERLEQIIVFCLISYRPLSLLEMAEACDICPGESAEYRACLVEEGIEICHLMRLTEEKTVDLLHRSVREFLLIPDTDLLAGERQTYTDKTSLPISELDAHALMAKRCIAVLLRTIHSGDNLGESQSNGFQFYATIHWMHHASMAADRFYITDNIEPFFLINSNERKTWLDWYRFHRRSEKIPEGFSIFHIAARWGIRAIAKFALSQQSKNENTRWFNSRRPFRYLYNDSDFVANNVTPLEEAARAGKYEIMVILLQHPPSTMNIKPAVVVAAAANKIHGERLIESLFGNRQKNQIQITANVLEAAARNEGKGKEIMELLLDRLGNNVEISENLVKIAASNWRNAKVMALLLGKHGDQIKITKDVMRAARKCKNEEMMRLLNSELERRSQFDGERSSQTATWNDIKKQVLANQASASCANRWGWTPLHAACWHGDIDAVELLLSKYKVDPLSMNYDEWTALDAAFAKHRMAIAQRLLEYDHTAAGNFTPTSFSETRKSKYLKLSNDKLEVSYIAGKGESCVNPFGLRIMLTRESFFRDSRPTWRGVCK